MNFKNTETKVFALGGLGEVGKNMYCIMHENEIVIIEFHIKKIEFIWYDYENISRC